MLKKAPLVSVLIPVYNAGDYLKEAVLSIINQSYTELEIIIINDGSTDGCLETIGDLKEARLRIIYQENQGKAAALNRAFDELQGDYFIIQDADDKSDPQRIEKQLECLFRYPELAAVYIGHDLILGKIQFAPSFEELSATDCDEMIKAFKIPAHDATGMYRLSLIKGMRFDKSLRIGQGVDFVLRIGEQFPMMCLGECLYTYRINYDSTIRQDATKNNRHINSVREKACQRRQLDFEKFKISFQKPSTFFKHRDADTHIIPHCMKSVLNLKSKQRLGEAFYVGWQCFILHPLDFYYVKPLLYALAPCSLISIYRQLKHRILHK
ncbi:MAG: glycosyltransferase family A protein [Methylococcales bacterium]|nr:glycosyltransferase family A protein [Methylococcales bacterium]